MYKISDSWSKSGCDTHASVPMKCWDHSFTTVVYLINRIPSSALPEFKTPFQVMFNRQPDYVAIKVFGCTCYPHLRPYNKHKLELISSKCLYLGVSLTHKGHKCLNMDGKIFISKDVMFNETKFPYTSSISKPSISHKSSNTAPFTRLPISGKSPPIVQHLILSYTINIPSHSPLQETYISISHVYDTKYHMAHDSSPSGTPQIHPSNSTTNQPQSSDTTATPSLKSLQTSHTNWHVSSSNTRSPSIHTQTYLPQPPLTINNHAKNMLMFLVN